MSVRRLQIMEVERLIDLGYSDFKIATETKADRQSIKRIRNGEQASIKHPKRNGVQDEATRYWICPQCQAKLKFGNNSLPNNECVACNTQESLRDNGDQRFIIDECDPGDVDLSGAALPEGAKERYEQVRTLVSAGVLDE